MDGGQTGDGPDQVNCEWQCSESMREASVSSTQATTLGTLARHWLTEAAATQYSRQPAVAVRQHYASAFMRHETRIRDAHHRYQLRSTPNSSGTVSLPLAGTPVNTGSSFPTDIISLVKPFGVAASGRGTVPIQTRSSECHRYVGVTSDYSLQQNKANTVITFGLRRFRQRRGSEFNSSDKEIFVDTSGNGNFDFAIFLSSGADSSTTSHTNVYFPFLVNLQTGTVTPLLRTNLVSPATRDSNSFNNSAVLVSVPTSALSSGNLTSFRYVVTTFDRNGAPVDQTPLLTYSLNNPGFVLSGGNLEPFFYNDLTTTSIPVQFNQRNFTSNGSLGVWLVHMHNGDGDRSDVVTFTTQ